MAQSGEELYTRILSEVQILTKISEEYMPPLF